MDIQPRVNDGGTADVRLKVIDEFTKGCPNPERSNELRLLIELTLVLSS